MFTLHGPGENVSTRAVGESVKETIRLMSRESIYNHMVVDYRARVAAANYCENELLRLCPPVRFLRDKDGPAREREMNSMLGFR